MSLPYSLFPLRRGGLRKKYAAAPEKKASATLGHGPGFASTSQLVLVTPAQAVSALKRDPLKFRLRNTVGAGDALLAAVAHQIEIAAPPQEWLRSGLAVGTLATQSQPGCLPSLPALRR